MSPLWRDTLSVIGGMVVVMAAFYVLALPRNERFLPRAWPAWAVVALFLLVVVHSMWRETLFPLLQQGATMRALRVALGLAAIVLALLVLIYGGFRFVSAMLWTMQAQAFIHNAEIGRAGVKSYPPETVRAARGENLRLLLHAARPGFLWMLAAFLLLALGGWLEQ